MVNLTLFALLTAVISLSLCFFCIVEFLFCYLSKWECKKYIYGTLPFTALQVKPTMMTSAAENPGNVKKVHFGNSEMRTTCDILPRAFPLTRSLRFISIICIWHLVFFISFI